MKKGVVFAVVGLIALIGAGCELETVATCDPGFYLPEGSDVCVPISGDSAVDAGDAGDAGDAADAGPDSAADAGPCGMECMGATPMCDPMTGMCVACLVHADCDDPAAAKCGAGGVCGDCDDSMQCGGITGAEVCATTGANAGACVQCADGELGACGGNPCNPVSNACSAYGDGVVGTCEACDSDANCGDAEHYCVPMEFPTGTARSGGYCLPDNSGGCDRPYSIDLTGRTSVSGVSGLTFCGINETLATCEAVTALLADDTCPGGMDSECPEGGICRQVGSLMNRCSYRCAVASECIDAPSAGNTCGAGTGGADYCGG